MTAILLRRMLSWAPRSRWAKIALDASLLAICYPGAYLLRTTGVIDPDLFRDVLWTTLMLVPIKVALLAYYGQYRVIWRYTSVLEAKALVKAASLGTIATIVLTVGMRLEYSRSAMAIDWLLMVMLLGAARIGARLTSEVSADASPLTPLRRFLRNGEKSGAHGERPRKVLIYGAGDAGEMIAREMVRPKRGHAYEAVGFVDDDPSKHRMSIHGLTVLGGREQVPGVVRDYGVEEIVITIPSARGRLVRELVRACEGSGARLKIVPGLDEIVGGKVRVADIRTVKVEDLLGREHVDLNMPAISSYLKGRRVMVTGAGGSIGSELCRQILQFGPSEMILFGRGENSIFRIHEELSLANRPIILKQVIGDVINRRKLSGVFRIHRPEIVFHAGADKHVPLMELNPDEAVLNNILGTLNVLEVADEQGVERVVCISTDKAVHPTSVMGCCKRVAELLVQRGTTHRAIAVAVRFGNVLGSRGSVIPFFQRQIERGGPVTVTHPAVRRYFMTIQEASQLVIQAGAMGTAGDLFILDMGEPVRILDLARDMIRLAGYEPEIDIPIRITGLRPGEKINEELVLPAEICEATAHEKILRVRGDSGPAPEALSGQIRDLTELAVQMDFAGVVRKLKEIVPEFQPAGIRPPGRAEEGRAATAALADELPAGAPATTRASTGRIGRPTGEPAG